MLCCAAGGWSGTTLISPKSISLMSAVLALLEVSNTFAADGSL